MARQKMIVPVFIPHQGCPYRCVFCNQDEITGSEEREDRNRLGGALKEYLFSRPRETLPLNRELAFYGGTFTGLPRSRQKWFLDRVEPLVKKGWIQSIRLSTHPKMLDQEKLSFLNRYSVRTLELGIQSTQDSVLETSGRGGALEGLPGLVKLIRQENFRLGTQLMVGLPGDSEAGFMASLEEVIDLGPDFVRLYPTVVIRDTLLHQWFLEKKYRPWSLDRTVEILKKALFRLRKAGIPVIRMGLHPEASLLENVVEGPVHPALRSLVESRLCLDEMGALLQSVRREGKTVIFKVPLKQISNYTGHRKENVEKLKSQFGLERVVIRGETGCQFLQLIN